MKVTGMDGMADSAGDVRFGIVGLGHVGRQQLEAGAIAGGCRIVDVCDVDSRQRGMLESSPAGRGVRFFDALDPFLGETSADVVVLATPTATHFDLAGRIIEAGRGLLVEKPATRALDEFEKLAALAARRGRFFEVALHAAHGLDVEWLAAARRSGVPHAAGRITGFRQGFFDPYIDDGGALVSGAASLDGSWLDSGINALSVMARFLPVELLSVREARLSRVPGIAAGSLQASVDIEFPPVQAPGASSRIGTGVIETNWTLGINRKTTVLSIDWGEREILLDHSGERVLMRAAAGGGGEWGAFQVLADLCNGRPRLVNHYVGVFEDAARRFLEGTTALPEAIALHRILFAAEAWEM